MVGAHVRDGLRAEVPPSVQRTSIQDHLREPAIVVDGGDHPAATRFPLPCDARVTHYGVVADGPIVWEGLRNQRHLGWIGHVESRVFHSKWVEQALLLKLVERFSCHDLDYPTEDIGRLAIVPRRAGLIGQWQLRYPLGELGVVGVFC